jgi:uncharacterized protein YacL
VTRRISLVLALLLITGLYGYLTGQLLLISGLGLILGFYLALLDWQLENYSFYQLLGGSLGFVAGLFSALSVAQTLLAPVTLREPEVVLVLAIGVYMGTYVGVLIGRKRSQVEPAERPEPVSPTIDSATSRKILDTSVIIDGRIAEIIDIGFLEGTLLVPRFILQELQAMADSGNNLKRNRGRRGLDILNRIREELPIEVEIVEKDYPDVDEVDAKLVELARDTGAKVITNDFNLNKVASLQDVTVLNINDLSNAVKPVYIPGETFEIEIIKEGEEEEQGVGYLEDGTMVVVEDAISHIGETIPVTVSSVIQTSAGRMVFARKGEDVPIED